MMKKLICLTAVLAFVMACSEAKTPTAGQKAEDTKTALTARAGDDPLLASVDNASIYLSDVEEEFNMLPPQVQEMFMARGGMASLVEELVKKEMLNLEALKKNYTGNADFKKREAGYRKRLMIEFLLQDEVEKKAAVTDADAKKYYDENIDDFYIEVPGKDKPEPVAFDSVKELISQRLANEKQRKVFDSYITTLKNSYKVELNKDAISRAFGNAPAAR